MGYFWEKILHFQALKMLALPMYLFLNHVLKHLAIQASCVLQTNLAEIIFEYNRENCTMVTPPHNNHERFMGKIIAL